MADLLGNSFDANGLTLATDAQVLAYLDTNYKAIYGQNVNLDADTPDGQWLNIVKQAILDLEDLLASIYSSFDPDNAIGVTLDQRVAINGIQREGGTFTVTNVTIVTTQSTNLYGLDQTTQPVYTVADQANNQWQLVTSQIALGSGTHVLAFRAAQPGQVLTVPNTITVPVTVVIGVASINNPTSWTTLGVNEESDALLKVRRQKSVANGSQGYLAGLIGVLENLSGMTYADVFENVTNTTDANGIPGHSIWVIVAGTAAASDIANAIYTKRNAGCGMKGGVSFAITQVDGTTFLVYWDDVVTQNLFIKMTVASIDGVNPPNIAAIREGLPGVLRPGVHATVNVNQVGTAVQGLDPNALASAIGLSITSSTGPFSTTFLTPTALNNQFLLTDADIILLPMQLIPSTSSVVNTTGTVTFQGLGGFGAYVYSFQTNNSGGSINASTGHYVAGATPSVTDTILVTDTLSNTATATVTVT